MFYLKHCTLGIDDQVRCFTCDGGLRRWDPDDDPWTEHCRWFPTCSFARRMKGDELIALIQASTKLTNGVTDNFFLVVNLLI
jgi:hypothetical protein